jgi:hypothetical protein
MEMPDSEEEMGWCIQVRMSINDYRLPPEETEGDKVLETEDEDEM